MTTLQSTLTLALTGGPAVPPAPRSQPEPEPISFHARDGYRLAGRPDPHAGRSAPTWSSPVPPRWRSATTVALPHSPPNAAI